MGAWIRTGTSVTLLAAALALPLAVAEAQEGAIKYRKSVMGGLGAHMGAISRIVRGVVPHTDHLGAHAVAIEGLAGMVLDATPEGSDTGAKNRALALIWEDWDGYVDAAGALQMAAAELVAAAEGGDGAAIGMAVGAVGDSCSGCHDTYRAE